MVLKMPDVREARATPTSGRMDDRRREPIVAQEGDTPSTVYYRAAVRVRHGADLDTTIYPLQLPVVWGGGTIDAVNNRYVLFLDSVGRFWIVEQSILVALQADPSTFYPTHRSTQHGWLRWQAYTGGASTTTPPTPPVETVTSDDGGEAFIIMYGSGTYALHAHYGANTRVLTLLHKQFSDTNLESDQHNPRHGDVDTDGSVYYDSDWHCWDFAPHAAAGDFWPFTVGTNGDGDGFWDIWPSHPIGHRNWRAPVFGLTIPGAGFDPTALFESSPPVGQQLLLSNEHGYGYGASHATPNTWATRAVEEVLVRGIITLPPLPSDPLVSITVAWDNGVAGYFYVDDVQLNKVLWSDPDTGVRPSNTAGIQENSRYPATGAWDWKTQTEHLWRWGADNLLSMKIGAQYGTSIPGVGDSNGAATWIDINFTFNNGTQYSVPADHWQTSGGVFTPVTETDPGGFFGRGVHSAVDLGNVGAQGRAYFRHEFTIIDVPLTGADLAISAETGLGGIWINGNRVDLGAQACVETTDLWSTNTVLNFHIPASFLLRNATNAIAVQAFSLTGPCKVVYALTIR